MFPPSELWLGGEIWMSLLMLTFMEIVLGIDNIIFISIAANRLPEKEQPRARNIGLILAMAFRLVLLFGISYFIAMQDPLFHVGPYGISVQALILAVGGLFLLYKATSEIHHKLEGDTDANKNEGGKSGAGATLTQVITQITIINIVFSFDSILTAIGLADFIIVMMVSVVISVIVMMLFAGPVGRFVNKHPTVQMLGLSFLILIGFMLITEGLHLTEPHIIEGSIPKGYLYFAIFFSLMVEFLNMRLRKKSDKKVQLNTYTKEAIDEGILNKK